MFHDLIEKAEEKGLYRVCIDVETQKLIDEAREITIAIAKLQRELGLVLIKLENLCTQKDIRMQDVIERHIQITNVTARTAVASHQLGDTGVGMDIQTQAARASSEHKAAIINAGHEGKTVIQATNRKQKTQPVYEENALSVLYKEKSRIEKAIRDIEERLVDVNGQLAHLASDDSILNDGF